MSTASSFSSGQVSNRLPPRCSPYRRSSGDSKPSRHAESTGRGPLRESRCGNATSTTISSAMRSASTESANTSWTTRFGGRKIRKTRPVGLMGAGGFETRPYVCLPGTRWGSRASLRVPRWGLACGGRLLGPRGGDFALGCSAGAGAGGFETRPYVCLFGTRWGGPASLRVPRWGLACGGRLVGPRGRLRLGLFCWCGRGRVLNPPLRLSLRDAVGGVGPPCGFDGGDWLVVGGWWNEGGDFALGCSAGAGAGGFETRPYVCLFGTRRGGPGLLRVPRWGLACGGRLVGPRGRLRLGLFCWCGRGRV